MVIVPVPGFNAVILSAAKVDELISINILPLPVSVPTLCDVIVPSDTVTAPLFILRVPVTLPPSLRANDVLTKVLPSPVTDLFSVPDKFKIPLLTIVVISSALVVVVPAFTNAFTLPSFVNVPEVTFTSPEIVPAFVKVPADDILPAISEFASTEITAFAFVPFTT